MQKANAQVRRKIRQMLCVSLEALVRIGAHGARIRKTESTHGFKPFVQEVVHQTLAQDHFGRLIEPHLRHVEEEQYARQLREDAELLDEGGHILPRQRIVEWSVPGVELDLHIGRCPHDRDQRADQHQEFVALGRSPVTRGHPYEIGEKTAQRRIVCAFGAIWWFAGMFRHRIRSVRPFAFSHDLVEASFADVPEPQGSSSWGDAACGALSDLSEMVNRRHPLAA